PLLSLLSRLACCPSPESAEGAAASVDSPCDAWADTLGRAAGRDSPTCEAVRAASRLLGEPACRAALGDIDAALALLDERRFACRQLESRLCADIGEDSDSCSLVRAQTPRLSFEECEEMLAAYEDVLLELRAMEARNAPVAPELWERITAASPAAFGPLDAPVVLVVFSDFLCPACAMAADALRTVREHYADSPLRIVVRGFPLPMHGSIARLAAEAALEAAAQDRFWEMHDALFAAQRDLASRADLDRLAADVGLDAVAFANAMDQHLWETAVDADMALGNEVLLEGTPTFLLDGRRLNVDFSDPENFFAPLDEALRSAGQSPPDQ
ncbi:MAG: thioredoxin domain-containing protein, partial [Deltaproteobacteria bacterium]|nr:thioredoxin domain-containing protein [Deltaproteobacteria bacterium]